MSSLTNSDDYQRGWKDGHSAALAGDDKDYSRMGMSWKFTIHGSKALDTYTQGYNEGYEAGIKEKNVVHKVQITNINNDSMAQQHGQDFIRELQALKNLNDYLAMLCDRLMTVNSQYKGYINVMEDTGVPIQQCKTYRDDYYVQDEQNFKQLYEKIINFDIPQIRKYIDHIAGQYQAATGQSIGSISLRNPTPSIPATPPRTAVSQSGSWQDIVVQADATANLMDFLVDQRDELKKANQEYKGYCNDMLTNGVPKQFYDHYVSNFATHNFSKINATADNLQDKDYPYLNKVFQKFISDLSAVGASHNRKPKSM
ncbi:MAG TPA: hypothetical protein PK692_08185 [Bacteroidales bacterium]|nr:hypothetical protein [Bacteroidales bacterium]HQO08019.1 hypothetical protein [Bacteroidales bacterium]HQP52509.1 hypothetical protein [Bacteroidales bacterium]